MDHTNKKYKHGDYVLFSTPNKGVPPKIGWVHYYPDGNQTGQVLVVVKDASGITYKLWESDIVSLLNPLSKEFYGA